MFAGLSGIHFLRWFRFSAPVIRVYGLHVSARYAAIMHCPDGCCYQGTTHVILVLLAMDGSTGKGRFQARRVQWDHRHDRDRISHYQFHSAEALLEDFWSAVDEMLRSV